MTATRREWKAWAACAVALGLLYGVWPGIDLSVSAWFFRPDGGFWVADLDWVKQFHEAVPWVGRALLILSGLVWLMASLTRSTVLRPHRRSALALVLSLTLGLGLLVHGVFKDHWGRARPVQIQEFGGTAAFTSPLHPARECQRNCSFVSGHAGTGFALIAAGTLGGLVSRRRWFWIGTASGAVLGSLRIAQGGHFLSDVLFGWLMLWAVSLAIRWAWVRMQVWRQHRQRAP